MKPASEQRIASAVIGVFLLALSGLILGPVLFGSVPMAVLPDWALPVAIATAALGAWHFITAAFARDEDMAWVTGYLQAHDAALLVLPISLFVGTMAVCRRLWTRAPGPRERWQARRKARRLDSRVTSAEAWAPAPHRPAGR